MYKVDWPTDITHNLEKYHEFVKQFLDCVNAEPHFSIKRKKDINTLKRQLKLLEKDASKKLFVEVSLNTNVHQYLLDLKYISQNLIEDYLELTDNYQLFLNNQWNFNKSYPQEVKDTFVYFYENLLKSKSFNKKFIGATGIVITQLRQELALKSTCPYCDIHSVEFDLTSVDHFIPKAKYPLLSIYPPNLVVACSACNERIKKENIYLPIMHPYFDNINEYFNFEYVVSEKKIKVNFPETITSLEKTKTENFLKLFKLETRYNVNKNDVYDSLIDDIRKGVRKYLKGMRCFRRDGDAITSDLLESVIRVEIDEMVQDFLNLQRIEGLTKLKIDICSQIIRDEIPQLTNYFLSEVS